MYIHVCKLIPTHNSTRTHTHIYISGMTLFSILENP